MKKLVIVLIAFAVGMSSASAAIRCERGPVGDLCCWDVDKEGPFRPINC